MDTKTILFALLILFIAGIGWLFSEFKKSQRKTNESEGSMKREFISDHYRKKDCILNGAEMSFYKRIKPLIPEGYIIFPQVVLSRLVEADQSKRNFWQYQNKINRKIVDFAIFRESDLSPVMVIEYDGRTHKLEKRKERDGFVNEVLGAVGIKVVHVEHGNKYSFDKLNLILPSLKEDF